MLGKIQNKMIKYLAYYSYNFVAIIAKYLHGLHN